VATADDFCQLVDILHTVHLYHRLVHRDVRLPNLLRDPETGSVVLNDWGCATMEARKVHFTGALQHAPVHVLESWARGRTYMPRRSDDLEMVVRSVFHSLCLTTFEQIRATEVAADIISFWKRHLAPPVWSDMLAAAQREDYTGLKALIRNLVPSG
jgi:serine/threonine protein kinase